MEFRCFARRRRLVAVSQRDATAFYPALLDRRCEILAAIRSFFDGVVAPRFASQDYTVDVYVMRDMRVKIVDFNPWGAFTLPLLFSWEELEQMKETEEVEIRVLESQCGVRPGLKTAVPYDYLDTGEGSGWDQFLRNAEEEIRRQARNSQNSDAAAGDY
ncbi:Cell division cycle protein 1 [Ananas comosus]|uniref:Cell division cycle protein 1 n=1 Tax=Ananas comosus TaxID=4615 RepID=A0A199UKW1_ANACO|nr:Cell division cycle protein 1 [Ananas comosus]